MKRFYLFFIGATLLGTNPAKAQSYCSPSYNIGCSLTDDYISNFTLIGDNGTTINNDSECTTGSFGFGGGYADYTSLTAAEITTGESYQISISTAAPIAQMEKVKIWVDWNNDGTFDEDEVIGLIDGIDLLTSTSTFSFTVPAEATAGKRRLRARMVSGASVGSIQPCGSADLGEAEDYSVQVVESCPEPTIAGIEIIEDIADHYYFTALDPSNVDSYLWNFGDGETSTEETPTHAYPNSGTYTVTLTVSNECGEYSTTSSINHTAASLEAEEFALIQIYPNPTTDFINIKDVNGLEVETAIILNLTGQVIHSHKGQNVIHVQSLNSGIYILQIQLTNGKVIQRKFEKI